MAEEHCNKDKIKMTPMIQQYMEIKGRFPDSILLFRLGDFYESFFDDAKIASKVLQLVLTSRNGNPLAGIPYHALDNYLKKLVQAGYKVAICDQMEDPAQAKGIVKREVTRVVSPGTVIEDSLVDQERNNFITAVFQNQDFFLLFLDISTGESFIFIRKEWAQVFDLLMKNGVSQVLIPDTREWEYRIPSLKKAFPGIFIEKLPDWYFYAKESQEQIKRLFKVSFLDYLELSADAQTLYGAMLKYLENQFMGSVSHLQPPFLVREDTCLWMDYSTIHHLNLIHREHDASGTSLFDVLNYTSTPMGSRLLRQWILFPLQNLPEITIRLDRIEKLLKDNDRMEELKIALQLVFDLDRIAARISYGRVNPRDLAGLRRTLQGIPDIAEKLSEFSGLVELLPGVCPIPELQALFSRALKDDLRGDVGEGGIIREEFDPQLDEVRNLFFHTDQTLKTLEQKERDRTGINTLKIGHNSVFGYYIEVPRSQTSKVPSDYERRQTLSTTERYVSTDLKPIEEKLLSAKEQITFLEKRAYLLLIETIKPFIPAIQKLSSCLSILDVTLSLAYSAWKNAYNRPAFPTPISSLPERSSPADILPKKNFWIQNGRHPIIERNQEFFIPNDCKMSPDSRFIILTGPNMAGKSTFLRQVALIAVMAQIGSYVPAERAELPIFDRIFTRIGARDDLTSGKSTFLVEMSETAAILNNATDQSLVILDEVGRGTSTYDGISIAWVVSEYIFNAIGAYCIFATHYNELTELGSMYKGIMNFRIKVTEEMGEVQFLYKVEEGIADRSYGIEVARIAGLPPEVIARANQVLQTITTENHLESKVRVLGNKELEKMKQRLPKSKRVNRHQMSFFEKEEG